jgi:hypothetical protein
VRRRLLPAALAAAVLAGCAAGPLPPAWESDARTALDGYAQAWFAGNARLAEAEFARAKRSLSATGRPELLARAELFRCALRAASLEFDDCPGYRALEAEAAPAERAYAAWLAGASFDAAQLPEPQRSAAARGVESLASIADPRSRLVAAGVLLLQNRLPPAGIAAAIDTASANGWRRPLIAWLELERARAEAAGDREAAARLARRIAIAAGQLAAP